MVKITGGTGRYRHAHGTVTAEPVGRHSENTDCTINLLDQRASGPGR